MSEVFTAILVIFTGLMGIVTATLYGILILTKLSLMNYEVAGRVSFVVSVIGIVATLLIAGDSYAVVCTWMSGISLVLIGGILIGLLARSTDWRR